MAKKRPKTVTVKVGLSPEQKKSQAILSKRFELSFIYVARLMKLLLEMAEKTDSQLTTLEKKVISGLQRDQKNAFKEAQESGKNLKVQPSIETLALIEALEKTKLKGGQGAEMLRDEATRPGSTISQAQKETTQPRIAKIRQGKRSVITRINPDRADDFKAIAAAKNMGVEAYLEKLILADVETNNHLIEPGRKKLQEPKQYRSRAALELEEQNRRLTKQLLAAGLKPQ